MLRAVLQDAGQRFPVREAQDVVEILKSVFRVTPGMRTSENGNRAPRPQKAAQRICRMGRLGEGADEEQIELSRQLLEHIFKAGIANEGDVMSLLSTPNADHLRHDT